MNLLIVTLWHGGLLLLPLFGYGVAVYCLIRYSKNKSLIPLWVGIFIGVLSVVGLVALLLDK